MKALATLLLAFASFFAQAQTYTPADCAISYRNDNAAREASSAIVGVPLAPKAKDYSWNMGVPFTLPNAPINSAKLVFPTMATGGGDAASGTAYLTILPSTDSASVCSGGAALASYIPPATYNARTKRWSSDAILAATVVTPMQTGDIEFTLNAAALAYLRTQVGGDVVFGVSMLIPRVSVVVDGETKKANQPGTVVNLYRGARCAPDQPVYCPSLAIQ